MFDETLKEDLEVIHRQAHRVAEITTALLAYARQSSHERAALDLNAVVRSALLLWQPQAEQVVRVETRLDEPLPPIMGNVTQLQQVLINLLSNALDATAPGGVIAIGTHRQGEPPSTVALEVTDTGSGIAPEHLSKVFDPFFTTKPPGKGTGLGLSVCFGIVQDHQGTITVDSRPGRGCTFTVLLPVMPRVERARQGSHRMLQTALSVSQDEGVG
jgi:signal transduction histidine kinase